MKVDYEAIIKAYENGESMNSIARAFGTYTTTVRRILEKHNIKLRHDYKKEGALYVKEGEKLIEWAKAQGRPVTKAELAKIAGTKRLSPSYFIKYPELGKYIMTREQTDLRKYYTKLYNWLQESDIPYKPNDRTTLGVSVDALLLGEYTGIAIQIIEKATYISKKQYEEKSLTIKQRAKEAGIVLVFLNEEQFEDLSELKKLLDSVKC